MPFLTHTETQARKARGSKNQQDTISSLNCLATAGKDAPYPARPPSSNKKDARLTSFCRSPCLAGQLEVAVVLPHLASPLSLLQRLFAAVARCGLAGSLCCATSAVRPSQHTLGRRVS